MATGKPIMALGKLEKVTGTESTAGTDDILNVPGQCRVPLLVSRKYEFQDSLKPIGMLGPGGGDVRIRKVLLLAVR